MWVQSAGSSLGGYNVIPGEAEAGSCVAAPVCFPIVSSPTQLWVGGAGFDCRIPVTQDLDEFKAMLDSWTAEAGVTYSLVLGGSSYELPRTCSG